MVKIAKEDTYATEDVGGGVTVRRQVKAGQPVPDHYNVEGDAETVEQSETTTPGYSAHDITNRVSAKRAKEQGDPAQTAEQPVEQPVEQPATETTPEAEAAPKGRAPR